MMWVVCESISAIKGLETIHYVQSFYFYVDELCFVTKSVKRNRRISLQLSTAVLIMFPSTLL